MTNENRPSVPFGGEPPAGEARRELLGIIRRLSLKRGSFVLSSGAVSDYYLDLRLTTTDPAGALLAARFLLEQARRLGANRVGGPTLGADPLVGAAVSLCGLGVGREVQGFIVRSQAKAHGTGKQIEGHLGPGDRALVFDDVVTGGGSILRAVEAARSAGAQVVGSWCLVDRMQGGAGKLREAGVPLSPVFLVDEVLAEDAALPDPYPSHYRFEPKTPYVTADAVIELEPGRILLVRRKNPPLGWALPGGFVDRGECVEDAVRREILEETGLEIVEVRQIHTYSEVGRDPRLHTATVVFAARTKGSVHQAGDDAVETGVFPMDALPEPMVFDHAGVISDYRTGRYGVGPGWRV